MTRKIFSLALFTSLAAVAQDRRIVTLEQAVRDATARSAQVDAARARTEAAEAGADSLRGRMLPGVSLFDEQQHYDSPFGFALGPPPTPRLIARNINTNVFSAAARQPLTGLLPLMQEHASLKTSARAAAQNGKAAEANVRAEIETGFLRLFEARALRDTAKASEEQLAEQVKVAQASLQAGAGTNADVLRVQVAVANARQQELQAVAQESIARAGLLIALGYEPTDESVDFAEPKSLELAGAQAAEADAPAELSRAFAQRPEIAAARLAQEAADEHASSKLLELLPAVSLEAGYTHIHGEILAPEDSSYVGLLATWNVFEWGADWYAKKAAGAQARAAAADARAARQRVGIEVSSRLAQVRAAASAVDVGNATIASAEEAFRVTDALVKVGSGTTTDLLDAQSALTQARLNLVRARYELALTRVALRTATGE